MGQVSRRRRGNDIVVRMVNLVPDAGSAKVLLRLPIELHEHLKDEAEEHEMSVNSLINVLITAGLGHRYVVEIRQQD